MSLTTCYPSVLRLRPQQEKMVSLIQDACAGTSIAIQAEVGTGKSRAALTAAALSSTGAIIVTSTKALSRQYANEVPLLRAAYPGKTFKVLSGSKAMGCPCYRWEKLKGHRASCPWPRHVAEARCSDVVITNFSMLAVVVVLGSVDLLSPPSGTARGVRTVIIDEAHDFAAAREPEPEDRSIAADDENVYWTPGEVSDGLLAADAKTVFISGTLNAHSHRALPEPFTLVAAGIPVDDSYVLPPAFDWSRQLTLGAYMCEDGDWPRFAASVAHYLLDGRGTLFITRSHNEKNRVADALIVNGFQTLIQHDPPGTPEQTAIVAAALNAQPGLCVIGTDTLMTGLDVPGDALGNVVVCGPPVLNGYWKNLDEINIRLKRVGGTSTEDDYQIPNRTLRLVQAIGRGVRSTTDTATVIVGIHRHPDQAIYDAAAARFR